MQPEHTLRLLTFYDLFDNVGTAELGYSPNAEALSGAMIAIDGFLAHAHDHPAPDAHDVGAGSMLVDQPGLCPDCSPVPAAVISLPGMSCHHHIADGNPVRIVGRLDFGFRIDHGVASFIRIEGATIQSVAAQSVEMT